MGVFEGPGCWGVAKQLYLGCMGVAGKGKGNVCLWDYLSGPVGRVVGEEYTESVCPLHCSIQISGVGAPEALVGAAFVVHSKDCNFS